MEYGTTFFSDEVYNDQYVKHVGFKSHTCLQQFFSKNNIDKISRKITELLMGVDKNNRPIIVPDKTITSVMSAVYGNFRPETGDIYSRYNIQKSNGQNYVQRMIDEVINIITTDVKVNIGMEEYNKTLTVWTTVLGDFNEHGLRQHPPIKLREKRPMPMAFNMNY
jgi:hypothetical protein